LRLVEDTQAETIVESITTQFDSDEINWQQKIVATMTDGCTMEGHTSGVKKRLGELTPQLKYFGACNDHHISNATKHGCKSFDSDTHELKHEYEIAKSKGRNPKALKQFRETRF